MNEAVDLNSPSVNSYMTILQDIITRMATNSANTKTWCIALVSAIIVIVADKGQPSYVMISLLPMCLFFLLDAYYLSLERQFRDRYNDFIAKLHAGKAKVEDVFIVKPGGGFKEILTTTLRSCGSVSVWPFYLLLILMLLLVRILIL